MTACVLCIIEVSVLNKVLRKGCFYKPQPAQSVRRSPVGWCTVYPVKGSWRGVPQQSHNVIHELLERLSSRALSESAREREGRSRVVAGSRSVGEEQTCQSVWGGEEIGAEMEKEGAKGQQYEMAGFTWSLFSHRHVRESSCCYDCARAAQSWS